MAAQHQLEFGRLLHGKIGGLGPFEYFVDVGRARRKKSRKSCLYDISRPYGAASADWPKAGNLCVIAAAPIRPRSLKSIDDPFGITKPSA